jgi:LytS/YehU family sensor histidine kinase
LPAELRELPVPPMLLQPLVENAIKHGLEPNIDGGHLRISAHQQGKALRLTVQDDGFGLSQQASTTGTGFGTQQVRERLRTQYGDAAAFTLVAATPSGCLATITLPV